mmetsp:Transcript_16274/g.49580  ORF Transcript_16274/g.49580 Transcript_16274/m.49580 type:complete len:766 (+) Transcript_16274:41-2338(+)
MAWVEGLVGGVAHKPSRFTVHAPHARELPCIRIRGDGGGRSSVVCGGEGLFLGCWVAARGGQYEMDVLLDGEHVQGSPFELSVAPPDPEERREERAPLETGFGGESKRGVTMGVAASHGSTATYLAEPRAMPQSYGTANSPPSVCRAPFCNEIASSVKCERPSTAPTQVRWKQDSPATDLADTTMWLARSESSPPSSSIAHASTMSTGTPTTRETYRPPICDASADAVLQRVQPASRAHRESVPTDRLLERGLGGGLARDKASYSRIAPARRISNPERTSPRIERVRTGANRESASRLQLTPATNPNASKRTSPGVRLSGSSFLMGPGEVAPGECAELVLSYPGFGDKNFSKDCMVVAGASGPARATTCLQERDEGVYALIVDGLTVSGTYIVHASVNGRAAVGSPHRIRVGALKAHADACYAELSGVALAGEPFEVVLVACDRTGERLQRGGTRFSAQMSKGSSSSGLHSLVAAATSTVHVEIADRGDGTHLALFQARVAGVYSLKISVDDRPIRGSPYEVVVAPGSVSATDTGLVLSDANGGWRRELVAGEEASIDLTPRDRFGNRQPNATEDWRVMLEWSTVASRRLARVASAPVPSTEQLTSDIELVDMIEHPDGGLVGCFTPTVAGSYRLSVTLSGMPVGGSPFAFKVIHSSVDPRHCGLLEPPPSRVGRGEAIVLTVALRDAHGNRCLGVRAAEHTCTARIRPPLHAALRSGDSPSIVPIAGGRYRVTLYLPAQGAHAIRVFVDGHCLADTSNLVVYAM